MYKVDISYYGLKHGDDSVCGRDICCLTHEVQFVPFVYTRHLFGVQSGQNQICFRNRLDSGSGCDSCCLTYAVQSVPCVYTQASMWCTKWTEPNLLSKYWHDSGPGLWQLLLDRCGPVCAICLYSGIYVMHKVDISKSVCSNMTKFVVVAVAAWQMWSSLCHLFIPRHLFDVQSGQKRIWFETQTWLRFGCGSWCWTGVVRFAPFVYTQASMWCTKWT